MARSIVSGMALLLSVTFLLGQDPPAKLSYEDVLVKMLETLNQMTKTLEMVVDDETAKANRDTLRGQAETFVATRKQSEALTAPPTEERERLARNFRPQFEKARKELVGQIARVKTVPGGTSVLQEIRGVFEKPSP